MCCMSPPSSLERFYVIGHIEQMFARNSVSAWGIGPNRHQALPDILGFGVFKVQCSGFCTVVAMDFEKTAIAFEQVPELRNGVHGTPITVNVLSDLIKGLTPEQIGTLVTAMGPRAIYKTTLGVGSMICIPPGMFQSLQVVCVCV